MDTTASSVMRPRNAAWPAPITWAFLIGTQYNSNRVGSPTPSLSSNASHRSGNSLASAARWKGFYRYTFKPAATRAGLDGRHFHKLRHTFATLALESRALDMHELSRAMGHASYAITDKVYAHVRPRDFSVHRAAFSAHIMAASATPAPVQLRPAAG